MDARLDPNAMLGLEVGDAHIIRFVHRFFLFLSPPDQGSDEEGSSTGSEVVYRASY
jgi:hypothetical protein